MMEIVDLTEDFCLMNKRIIRCCIGLIVICSTLVFNVNNAYATSTDVGNNVKKERIQILSF